MKSQCIDVKFTVDDFGDRGAGDGEVLGFGQPEFIRTR
jgi:hypothetical protein